MNPEIFTELSIILLITVVVTGFIRLLKQPAIIGYILSGILAGPFVFNIIDSHDTLSAFSQIGIALLLFLVGLNEHKEILLGKHTNHYLLSQIPISERNV